MSTDATILGGVRWNTATVEQEECITKKKKENKKLLLEIKTVIAAIKNSAEKLEDKLTKSFRIWSKDLDFLNREENKRK